MTHPEPLSPEPTELDRIRRPRIVVAAGAVVLSAGRVLDLWWHTGHDDFETGIDQLQAHWLAWLGALVLLAASAAAVRNPLYRSPGLAVVFVSAALYAAVAVSTSGSTSSSGIPTFPTSCWRYRKSVSMSEARWSPRAW